MKHKRQANIELLRIILMCTIPVYHLMLYNGVFYADFHSNYILAIIFSVGGAIPADYAFMAISAYYLQRNGTTQDLRRIMRFCALLLTLYAVKTVILRGLFGFHNTKYFVDLFLMNGAWWYARGYLVLLIIYPFLNYFLEKAKKGIVLITTIFWGCLFLIIGIRNEISFTADILAFVFLYLFMGVLRAGEYRRFIGLRATKWRMITVAIGLYLVMLLLCLAARIPQSMFSVNSGIEIVKRITGRYSFFAACMGVAVFLAAKSTLVTPRKWIYGLADCTIYVFLLHDTIMGIFWYFGKCWNDFSCYSPGAFIAWTIIYLVICFLVAFVFGRIYASWIAPMWEKVIDWIYVKWKLRRMDG